MSLIPTLSLSFSVLSFIAGWYLNERKHKSQKKNEIKDDMYPKIFDDFKKGVAEFESNYKEGFLLDNNRMFNHTRNIIENGRINYIRDVNKTLYDRIINFMKKFDDEINSLDEIKITIKESIKEEWGNIDFILMVQNIS